MRKEKEVRKRIKSYWMIVREHYDLTPLVFENEGYACRTRLKLRQPIYCTGSCGVQKI